MTDQPIESTGHRPTESERQEMAIAECKRQIEKYQEKLKVLEAQ